MVNLFLCYYTNYLENQLLINGLIIVRNQGDDEDIPDTKDVMQSQGNTRTKVEIESNSEF
jgi:hypothetical protein